jgi:hypothetical protein
MAATYPTQRPVESTRPIRRHQAPHDSAADRYNKSIAERSTLPSTPPDVSITLEKRFSLSMRRVPHVWSARVQSGSPNAGTTTGLTTYPPLLIAKIFDPVFFDDDEAEWYDPFALRDLGVSYEVETYERPQVPSGN